MSRSGETPTPSRLIGDLAANTPIALTTQTKAAGFTAPKDPRIFIGVQVTKEGGGPSGKLVGYTTSGNFLVDVGGKRESFSRVSVAPGQQFTSVCQTLKGSDVVRPTGKLKADLDALNAVSVGYGKKSVSDVVDVIRDAGFEALIVGGAVRDAIQGKPRRDADLVTTMWIREADKAMSAANISTGWTRAEFGVMLVGRGSSNGLEVASLETSRKGEFGFDLEEDLPLIPPTYANLTRFHGVFAPTSRLRDKVVPTPASTSDDAASPAAAPVSPQPAPSPSPSPPSPPSPKSPSVRSTYLYDWAALLSRVFGVDVLQCSRCQGKMRLIACIEEPDVARKILEHLGLRAEALPTLRAQAPPVTLELFPAA